jgi:outer membrane protein assembly factor BamB
VDVPLRALLLLGLAAVAAGSARAPHAAPPCYDAAIVSLRDGAMLHRYHASDGGLVRANSASPSSPLLPGEDAVTDGSGGWYVAGAGLAHLLGNGRLDRSWHSQLHRHLALWTLARAGGRLVVSDGQRVYAVDATTGKLLWGSAAIGGGSMARILVVTATARTIFVGGAFKRFGSSPRRGLAALSASDGRILPWHAPTLASWFGTPPSVTTLAVGEGRLYFAGTFGGVAGAARVNGVAAVRLHDGRLTRFAPRAPTLGTLAIAVVHENVVLGGGDSSGIFDATTGTLRHRSATIGGVVAVRGWTAYTGGSGKYSISPHNLLAVDVRTGDSGRWVPNVAPVVGVATIALSGDKALLGGQFCQTLG